MPEDRPEPPPSGDALAGDSLSWALDRVSEILDDQAAQSGLLDIRNLVPPPEERRRAPRYSLEEPAQVELESWAELLELYTKDISNNGIFIRTEEPPETGSRVGVHLLLPDGSGTIRFQGEVVRIVRPAPGVVAGFGVQFYGVTQEAKNTLQWIIAQARAVTEQPAPPQRPAAAPTPSYQVGTRPVRRPPNRYEREQAERRRLRAILCELGARDDLSVLQLHGRPSLHEIDDAFYRASRQWDPARLGRDTSPELIRLNKAIHFRIQQAYHRARAAETLSSAGFTNALSSIDDRRTK
ncbi:MAG: PilZ domain-containing protein [Myxococcota bacterium]